MTLAYTPEALECRAPETSGQDYLAMAAIRDFPDFLPDTYRTREPYLPKPFSGGLSLTVSLSPGVKRNSIFSIFHVVFIDTAFLLWQLVWDTGTRKPFSTFGARGRRAPTRGRERARINPVRTAEMCLTIAETCKTKSWQ
jgi:hypothetical protein